MSRVREIFAEQQRLRAEQLAAAEVEARQSGKELFDLARLEAVLNRGSQAAREKDHRLNYYLLHPELRTLEEYAKLLIAHEPWEDCP